MCSDSETLSAYHQLDSGATTIECVDKASLPSELAQQVPREVPQRISRHKRIRRPWLLSWVAVVIFLTAICLGARPMGGPWARIAFWTTGILGLLGTVGLFTSRSELKYVRHGRVGHGQVLAIRMVPGQEYQGQVIAWKHIVDVQMQCATGQVLNHQFSGLQISSDDREHTEIAMRVGDLVPVVWLDGRFEKSARLYPFLVFNCESSLRSEPTEGSRSWKRVGSAVSVLVILGVLFGNVLLFMWSIPVAFSIPVVTTLGVVGGLCVGGVMLFLMVRQFQRENRRMEQRNREALTHGGTVEVGSAHVMMTNSLVGWGYRLVVGAGSLLVGGLTVVMWTFGMNVWLDRGLALDRVIVVDEVRERPGQSRTTEVSFHPIDEPNGQYSKNFSPRDLPDVPLFVGGEVIVEWHQGAFGWPWVRDFRSIPIRQPGEEEQDGQAD